MNRLLSVCAALACMFVLSAPAFADDAYRIHGGDELTINVYGEKDLPTTAKVLPSGTISYPLVGELRVAGLTPTQAGALLATNLSRYIRRPQVAIAVAKEGPIAVLVLGNVKTPGKYELPSRSRITDALASAGGLGVTDGSLPDARLATAAGDVKNVSLQGLLHNGDTSQNVPLADEMTVYVPSPLTLNVQVLGAVDRPGDIVVREGDRLSMAVARAGNSANANADLNHITVRRQSPDGSVKTYNVNLYDVLKSGDVNRDLVMQKNDLVYVPQSGGRNDRTTGPLSVLLSLRHLVGLP